MPWDCLQMVLAVGLNRIERDVKSWSSKCSEPKIQAVLMNEVCDRSNVDTLSRYLQLGFLLVLLQPTTSFQPPSRHIPPERLNTQSGSLMMTTDDYRRPKYDKESGRLLETPCRMVYVAPTTERALLRRDVGGFDSDITGADWHNGDVWVHNGRARNDEDADFGSFHANGFQLVRDQPVDHTIDFLSKTDVLDRYYPLCERLLNDFLTKQSPDGTKVSVQAFDHNIRQQQELGKENPETQTPIAMVHGDYTTVSAPRRLQLLAEPPKVNDIFHEKLGDLPLLDPAIADACTTKGRRYALVNLWRSFDTQHPVQSFPLACIDAATVVDADDLRVLEIRYADRIGENYLACPSPDRHRWVYFPQMTMDEVLLIKQWDSDDTIPAKFSIHSAFTDPTTAPDAPPRRSIEVRCVVIWETSGHSGRDP